MQAINKKQRKTQRIHSEWAKERDRAKLLWIVTTLAFWISLAILGFVYLLKDELHFVLISVVLGMLLLGIWLKLRYKLVLRREPDNLDNGEDNKSGL